MGSFSDKPKPMNRKSFLSTKLEQGVNLAVVKSLIRIPDKLAMALIYTRHAGKSKAELLDEIVRLEKEVKSRNDEIAMLKKKITLYKSI